MSARRKLVRAGVVAATVVGVGAVFAGPADANCSPPAYCGPAYVSLVSKSSTSRFLAEGAELEQAKMSADGRYVVFTTAGAAVPEDTNGTLDVYRRDLTDGTIVRVSTGPLGGQSHGDALGPSISADGRYVAFVSSGNDLQLGRPSGAPNTQKVYRKDLETGAVKKVSTTATGADPSDPAAVPHPTSTAPDISADGRFVAFHSLVVVLVGSPSTNESEVYRKDLSTGIIVRVSQLGAGMANDSSGWPSISDDGRLVAFASEATNLAANTNPTENVYRKDLTTGTVVLANANLSGTASNAPAYNPDLSGNGRYVVFDTIASNLSAADTNGNHDVYRKDLTTGAVDLVSASSTGVVGNVLSWLATINGDGHVVVFGTLADNLVPGDTNASGDVFYKNLNTGVIQKASTRYDGGQVNDFSDRGVVSADGQFVTFMTWATNVVPGDTNLKFDVFRTNLAMPV